MPVQMPDQTRKRILMFYFAAGINIVMAMWVVSAAAGQVSGLMLGMIVVVFLGFAWINFHFAKMLRKRWEAQVRQQLEAAEQGERVNG